VAVDSVADWHDTRDTLHLYTQVVGKVRVLAADITRALVVRPRLGRSRGGRCYGSRIPVRAFETADPSRSDHDEVGVIGCLANCRSGTSAGDGSRHPGGVGGLHGCVSVR
jgi:hypothetical protein